MSSLDALQLMIAGHAYSHPSNLFWKLLESSGVTPKRHLPSETRDLMDLYSIGNTNICARPTRSGDGLSKDELIQGASILEDKIALYKPEAVCIVGKGIWDVIFKAKTGKQLKTADFSYGWQDEELWLGRTTNDDGTTQWPGAKTFVSTTTSGLAAGMKPHEKLEVWKPLGDWVQERRGTAVKKEADVKVEEAE